MVAELTASEHLVIILCEPKLHVILMKIKILRFDIGKSFSPLPMLLSLELVSFKLLHAHNFSKGLGVS